MSRLCPTAAAACFIGRLLGYSRSPSFSIPQTIAPEETMTISLPLPLRAQLRRKPLDPVGLQANPLGRDEAAAHLDDNPAGFFQYPVAHQGSRPILACAS